MALVQELLHPRVSTSYSHRGRGEQGRSSLSLTCLDPSSTPRGRTASQPCTLHCPWTDSWTCRRSGLTSASSLLNQARQDPTREQTRALRSSGLRKTSRTFQRSQSVFGFALSREGAEGGGRKITGGAKSKACSISRNLSLYFRGKVTL